MKDTKDGIAVLQTEADDEVKYNGKVTIEDLFYDWLTEDDDNKEGKHDSKKA